MFGLGLEFRELIHFSSPVKKFPKSVYIVIVVIFRVTITASPFIVVVYIVTAVELIDCLGDRMISFK